MGAEKFKCNSSCQQSYWFYKYSCWKSFSCAQWKTICLWVAFSDAANWLQFASKVLPEIAGQFGNALEMTGIDCLQSALFETGILLANFGADAAKAMCREQTRFPGTL